MMSSVGMSLRKLRMFTKDRVTHSNNNVRFLYVVEEDI